APSVIRNPPGMLLWATPGWALDSTTTEAIRKMMVRIGNAYRSKYCTRWWPKTATTTCTSTTMTRQAGLARWVSVLSANVALTLFTANQPIPAVIEFSPAGTTWPQEPKPSRLSTICGTPNSGPSWDSRPWETPPSAVPITMARNDSQKLRPNAATPSTPTKIVANSMFGETQVQNKLSGLPCRSCSGMNSAPPGSTA